MCLPSTQLSWSLKQSSMCAIERQGTGCGSFGHSGFDRCSRSRSQRGIQCSTHECPLPNHDSRIVLSISDIGHSNHNTVGSGRCHRIHWEHTTVGVSDEQRSGTTTTSTAHTEEGACTSFAAAAARRHRRKKDSPNNGVVNPSYSMLYSVVRELRSLFTNKEQNGLVLAALYGFPQLTELIATACPSDSNATLSVAVRPFKKNA